VKHERYEAEVLIYGKTSREAFGLAPPLWIGEQLLRKTVNMSYHVLEDLAIVGTLPKDYAIIFEVGSEEDKCLLLLTIPNFEARQQRWKELEIKVREAGFNRYICFDERMGFSC